MVPRRNIRRLPTMMTAVMRHLLLRWKISSSNAIVAERLDTREMTVPTRNKAMTVVVGLVAERDQSVTKRRNCDHCSSRAISKPSVGRSILN